MGGELSAALSGPLIETDKWNDSGKSSLDRMVSKPETIQRIVDVSGRS